MIRLETISKEVSSQLSSAAPEARIHAAIAACALAMESSGLDARPAILAWERIRARGSLSEAEKQQLRELSEQLDDDYLNACDDSEDGGKRDEDYLLLFSKARAAAALVFAAEGDEQSTVAECIYEAAAAGDQERVLAAVKLALQGSE